MLMRQERERYFSYGSATYCKPFSPVIHPPPLSARDPARKIPTMGTHQHWPQLNTALPRPTNRDEVGAPTGPAPSLDLV